MAHGVVISSFSSIFELEAVENTGSGLGNTCIPIYLPRAYAAPKCAPTHSDSWSGVNHTAKVVTCLVVRTERTFGKRRVQLGEVVWWVEQSIILRKNLYYGHFHWFFSDLHYQNLEFVIPNLFEEQLSDT